MKILGLCCGRKMGNSEILVREALMGAEGMGIDVEIIRLSDLYIKPCTGCNSCQLSYLSAKDGKCPIKGDDMPFFRERFLESDGIIIGTPAYEGEAPGYLKVLIDRMGPAYDIGFALEAKRMGCKTIDERFFKPRVIAFIAVGGGPTYPNLGMTIPLMHRFTYSMMIPVVDQMMVGEVGWPGDVLMDEEGIKRANQLGRNVAGEIGKPREEVRWMGGKQGICPVCHSNILHYWENGSVNCSICMTKGAIRIVDGEVTVAFEVPNDRYKPLWEYKVHHLHRIGEQYAEFEQRKGEIQKRLKKYESHIAYSKPHVKS